jgi:hypothetical protein
LSLSPRIHHFRQISEWIPRFDAETACNEILRASHRKKGKLRYAEGLTLGAMDR